MSFSIWFRHQMLLPRDAWGGSESCGQTVRRTPRVRVSPGWVLPAPAPSSAQRFGSFLRTAWVWTGNAASFFGHTNHALVSKAKCECDVTQGDGQGMGQWVWICRGCWIFRNSCFWITCIVSSLLKHWLHVIPGSIRLETGGLTLCYSKYAVFLLLSPRFFSAEMPWQDLQQFSWQIW